jgi:type II secretion system protein N
LLDEGQLAGRLSGQFSFEARGTNLNAAQGSGEVTIDGIGLSAAKVAGFTVPDLHFRQTKLKFTLHAGRVEVQDLTAAGDVNVQGGGQVVLRAPLQDSILNLRGTVLPTPTTPDALRAILALIPRAPGSKPDAPVTVTGTLARPRLR